jgi:hypothetical protein
VGHRDRDAAIRDVAIGDLIGERVGQPRVTLPELPDPARGSGVKR